MPKITYGSRVKARAKQLLEALLDFVNDEIDECDHIDLKWRWEEKHHKTHHELVVETNLRALEELVKKGEYKIKLTKAQIRQALRDHMRGFLAILKDNRTKQRGSEDWHFTLILWSKDKNQNLKKFEEEWKLRQQQKYKKRKLSDNQDDFIVDYVEKYKNRYGKLKVLGMPVARPLASVYTSVQFLDELSSQRFEPLEALEEDYRKSQVRRFQTERSSDKDDIAVANENQYLMVLGGAGSGKTTFLRRIGLEALKNKEGRLEHRCIPIFLELKHLTTNKIDLKELIVKEFEKFSSRPSENFIKQALVDGELLILLDGLDELPEQYRNPVIEAIEDLAVQYERNHFIVSCRTATYRSSFQGSTIELADFDDIQIKQFIDNWFQSELDRQIETAKKCWEILNQSRNKAAKELAQTPLLLTFLCLVYDRHQNFPNKRSTLYRKALDILLEKWAAEKRVPQTEIYQGLHTDLEKILLSKIAYEGFEGSRLFFDQQYLVNHINEFLADTVDNPKYLNGKAVLDAIAEKQGILIERAQGIYSFSHLTFQEYLTAQYIVDNNKIDDLVEQHLADTRWREVFILVAGLMVGSNGADELLQLMEEEAQNCISNPQRLNLLSWENQSEAKPEVNFKPLAQRVLVLVLALTLALAYALDHSPPLVYASALLNDLTLTKTLMDTDADAFADVFNKARTFANAIAFAHTLAFTLSGTSISTKTAKQYVNALAQTIDQADSLALALREIDFFEGNCTVLMEALNELRGQLPRGFEFNSHRDFLKRMQQIWLDSLKLDRTQVELSQEEVDVLYNYLYANLLMIDCKKSAVRVSKQKWAEIEKRMLLIQA